MRCRKEGIINSIKCKREIKYKKLLKFLQNLAITNKILLEYLLKFPQKEKTFAELKIH